MFEVRDLHVRYGATHAVRGIDLQVTIPGVVALLGPNGAGKTSVLRAISGQAAATGSVLVEGDEILGRRSDEIARRGVVQVPEGRRVFASLTVKENLQLGSLASGRRSAEYGVDDIFDLFPALVPLRDRLGYALSGGEQQMVALGRALVGAPSVLLLDEPSLGLAPVIVNSVVEALRQIRGEMAILLVEQNSHIALRVASFAYVLSGGELVRSGTSDELSADDLLASYLGRDYASTAQPAYQETP